MKADLLPLIVRRALSLFVWLAVLTLSSLVASAADATATIVGRVFNPATQEYVRNAEVTIVGSNFSTYSADDGSFSLGGVPAGAVTLRVSPSTRHACRRGRAC